MTKETMKLALEALELAHPRFGIATEKHKQAITAIKVALAQPADHSEQHLDMVKARLAKQEVVE